MLDAAKSSRSESSSPESGPTGGGGGKSNSSSGGGSGIDIGDSERKVVRDCGRIGLRSLQWRGVGWVGVGCEWMRRERISLNRAAEGTENWNGEILEIQ